MKPKLFKQFRKDCFKAYQTSFTDKHRYLLCQSCGERATACLVLNGNTFNGGERVMYSEIHCDNDHISKVEINKGDRVDRSKWNFKFKETQGQYKDIEYNPRLLKWWTEVDHVE